MIPIAIVARGAVSPLGIGEQATAPGAPGIALGSAFQDDAELQAAGLSKPRSARAPVDTGAALDRAHALLAIAAGELVQDLARIMPAWRERRFALCVGTSSGGMASLSRVLDLRSRGEAVPPALARAAFYDGPLEALAPALGRELPRVNVLGACVASTVALGLGCRWLEAGHCDLVIAGGYDALALTVATGFEALGATSATAPTPFAEDRDGMVLGEGAVLVALMRAAEAPSAIGTIRGFAASSDATHVTAPDARGLGLLRAARLALADAGVEPSAIGLVSAHATATPHNDAAEAAMLRELYGSALPGVVVHALKARIGHTLGAAGALEALSAVDAMRRGVLPGSASRRPVDPTLGVRLLEVGEPGVARRALKLSAAFAGANATLVLDASPSVEARAARPQRRVTLLRESALVVEPDLELLARHSRLDELRRSRLDRASALALTAAASVLDAVPDPTTTAVVVGTFAASIEATELFEARRRERGPSGVEPRRFPATSPNLPPGWCTIAFGWLGPSIAVGGGPGGEAEALAVGYDLVAGGDAERAVVIVCNDAGDVTLDLCRAAGIAPPIDGARALVLGTDPSGHPIERSALR